MERTDQKSSSRWSKLVKTLREVTDDEEEEEKRGGRGEEEEEDMQEAASKLEIESKMIKSIGSNANSTGSVYESMSHSITISLQALDKFCGITPTSQRGQTVYMFIMLLIPLIPIFALITQNVILLNDIILRKADLVETDASVERSDETARLVSNLQQERSETLLLTFITNQDNENADYKLGLDLNQRYLKTDKSLDNISDWRSPDQEAMFRSKLRFQIRLDDFRKRVIKNNLTAVTELAIEDSMNFYNYATRVLLDDLSRIIRTSNGSRTWRYLITYKNILRGIESIGIEMSYGLRYIGRQNLTQRNFANFIQQHKLSSEYLRQGEIFVPAMREEIRRVRESESFQVYNLTYGELVRTNSSISPNVTLRTRRILRYFKSSVATMDLLRALIFRLRGTMKDLIRGEIGSVDREYAVGITVLTVLFLISPLIVILIRNAVNALQIFSTSLRSKARQLRREKKRSETLVYQMLPKSVANLLKSKKTTSEMFESATVCFTEIDGFKAIARTCAPLELFDLLNIIYKTFDARIDSYDVYKVETINDSYMVASGLPERNGDRHAAEIANLCIDLIFITPGILIQHDLNLRLKIRIGIHTGATTAGVVGSKMPRYCLFGDTVNVASRMQSTGEAMKIQMSYETKMLLDNLGGYISEMRGQVEVKGKGLMDTYWLLSRA